MDNSDLTVHVLREIRDLIGETNSRLDAHVGRLDRRLDELTAATRDGFREVVARIDGTNARIDDVVLMIGTHHRDLETRVTRLEDHVGISR